MTERVPVKDAQVWLGMHGDEYRLAKPFYASLQETPIPKVDVDIANPKALEAEVRGIDANLALCFQEDPPAGAYESGLVPGILRRSRPKGLTVDIHENRYSEHDYAFIGPEVHRHVLGFAALLEINDLVVSSHGMFNRLPNATLVDVAPCSLGITWTIGVRYSQKY